jgi:hypothetical protein
MSAPLPQHVTHAPYDPWADIALNWPEVEVVLETMRGSLLGELRYPVIALRAGTSAAQRRCTLAHEIVHLERGTGECGPWSTREELYVHRETALRLITVHDLAGALRSVGGGGHVAALAQALEVDLETAQLRLDLVTPQERARLRAAIATIP